MTRLIAELRQTYILYSMELIINQNNTIINVFIKRDPGQWVPLFETEITTPKLNN